MKRIALSLCFLTLASGLFWQFPLFHIVRTDEREPGMYPAEFNAAEFTETFWVEQLVPSLRDAPDAADVLAAFRENPQAARNKFGRKVGISRTRLFMLRGSGTIVTLGNDGIGVTMQDGATEPDLVIDTGLLFGNVVRDASGLLDPSDYSNSKHFNDVSTELNGIVEARVIPKLKDLSTIGQKIQFVGCAEVPDDVRDVRPLKIIVLDVNRE